MSIPLMIAAMLLGGATAVASQSHAHSHPEPEVTGLVADTVLDSFLARAREAGSRYQDRRTAISDGFRRLGPDFPSMGEHWVHPSRMMDRELNADYPQALSYALIAGVPALTGVIYARPLLPGEAAPDFPPGINAWHDHSGSIDEESVVLRHSMHSGDVPSETRLAMLHIWGALANPAGVFESDNWALPFARSSLDVPDRFEIASAKSLSLASGGDTYYLMLFQLQARPDPEVAGTVEGLIARARREVDEILSKRSAISTLGEGELVALEQVWIRLWTEAGTHLSADAREELQELLMD